MSKAIVRRARLTAAIYIGVVALVSLFTWPAIIRFPHSFGNSLLISGFAVAVIGGIGMGISGTGRYSDMGPLLRDQRSHQRLMERGAEYMRDFLPVVFAGLLSAGTGFVVILIVSSR